MERKLNMGLALSLLVTLSCLVALVVFRQPRDTRPKERPQEFIVEDNQRFLIYSDPPGAEVHLDNPPEGTAREGPLTNGDQAFELKKFKEKSDGKSVTFFLKKKGYETKEFRVAIEDLQYGIWPAGREGIAVLEPTSFWVQAKDRHPLALILFPISLLAALGFWKLKDREHRRILALATRLEEAGGDPFVGTRIGEYLVHKSVGKGKYGTVYKATVDQNSKSQEFAIKILDYNELSGTQLETNKGRFDREMELLKTLHHPNIGRVVDFGRAESYDWVLMPFYTGDSLDKRLKKGRLSQEEILDYARDIAQGLQAAHNVGVYHRDLKAENVMLHEGAAVVIDFGLARGENQKTLTMEGSLLGNPLYMAPEQLSTSRVDGKADQYAYGIMLFQFLTGQSPFDDSFDVNQLLGAKLCGNYLLLREVDPTQSAEMEAVISKMMSQSASHRYSTLTEAYEAFAVEFRRQC